MSNENQRTHERFPFTAGMWVKIIRVNQLARDFKMYQLMDLSQGGISFKSHLKNEFRVGDRFLILEVENLVLKDKIKAIVRYVQPVDEFGVDFKIGVEFLSRH